MRDRYDPMALLTLVPALSVAMEPILTQLDQLLEDDALLPRVKADLRRRRGARRIAAHLGHYLPLVRQAIRPAPRRVLEGAMVPAGEKLVSLVEPHPQVIQRQKPGQPVEFGRKVWLAEVEGGLLRPYRSVPVPEPDHPYLRPSLEAQLAPCGTPPWLVAGDRGVSASGNERLAEQGGVRRVVIP